MKLITLSKEEFEVKKRLGFEKFTEIAETWKPLKVGRTLRFNKIKWPGQHDKPTPTS